MNPVQITILAFMAAMTVICVVGICFFIYDAVSSFIRWRKHGEELSVQVTEDIPPGSYTIRAEDGTCYAFETTQPIPAGGVIRMEERGEQNGNDGCV